MRTKELGKARTVLLHSDRRLAEQNRTEQLRRVLSNTSRDQRSQKPDFPPVRKTEQIPLEPNTKVNRVRSSVLTALESSLQVRRFLSLGDSFPAQLHLRYQLLTRGIRSRSWADPCEHSGVPILYEECISWNWVQVMRSEARQVKVRGEPRLIIPHLPPIRVIRANPRLKLPPNHLKRAPTPPAANNPPPHPHPNRQKRTPG